MADFSLFFWVATFCERGLGVRVVRRVRVIMPGLARKRPWGFLVGLAEVRQRPWVATFCVQESRRLMAAGLRRASGLRLG